jgi:tRNA (guanine37-N1)-methyltransferase
MLTVETLSVFPEMFAPVINSSILGRAQNAGLLRFVAHDLRDWTHDRHRTTDDEIYGGGAGLLMRPEPIFEALDDLLSYQTKPARVIFFAPHGVRFSQHIAEQLAQEQRLIMVCGRYEGIDERAFSLADYLLSLGDFILTGGELAAMCVTDAVCRLLPGVLGDEQSSVEESFSDDGLLEYPQYTRPAIYRGQAVPEVLLSGNHGKIASWRREQAIIRTASLRPDLLSAANLSLEERKLAARVAKLPCDELITGQ